MNIYVGRLSAKTTETQVRAAFAKFGKVGKVRMGEKPKENAYRFCFVEMPYDAQAARAIKELHGTSLTGSILAVSESALAL